MQWPKLFQKEIKSSVSEAQILHPEHHDYAMQDWRSYAREGYAQNPTIFRCIDLIAKNAASITPKVKVRGIPMMDHPLTKLLDKPNIGCGGVEFRTEVFSWILLTGNVFTERLKAGQKVTELWNWQPYAMSIARSTINPLMPMAYKFNKDGMKQRRWDVDPTSGACDMMHWGLFNPSPDDAFIGLSPLSAAASAGDQLNASNKWRYDTFKNDCRPSGILSTEQAITPADHKTLTQTIKEKANSKFLLLGGGLKWQQLGLSAKDADYLAGSKFNKQEICEVFGVPPQLIGIEGSQTFANFEEARYGFWLTTVIPLMDLWYSEMNRWLAPLYGDNVEIYYDESEITALDYVRNKKVQMCLDSKVLSMNEKRELLGYEPSTEPDADALFVDPNLLPMGTDVFMQSEKPAQQAAQSFMKMGMSRADAETKAFEIFNERKCLHHK